jgi:hypothetical protein
MQKWSTLFSHFGSFDHPDLQSLDDYNFFSDYNLFGVCNIPLERYFQDLSNCILQVSKFQTYMFVDQRNKSTLKFLSSRCPTLFDETYGSNFKG